MLIIIGFFFYNAIYLYYSRIVVERVKNLRAKQFLVIKRKLRIISI